MRYKLLVILLALSTITNAQKVWDKEAYSALCKKELNSALVHIYDLVIEGKLTAYQNDSMVSRIQRAELEERLIVTWMLRAIDYRFPDDPYSIKDTMYLKYLNPRIDLKCFGKIKNQSINAAESSTNSTLGINLFFHPIAKNIELRQVYLCAIKWQDLEGVLSKNEIEIIQGYIQTTNFEETTKYLNKQNDSLVRAYNQHRSEILFQDKNQMRLTLNWQNAITTYWFSQYIHAAKMASINGKKGYKDANLNEPFDNLEKGLIGSAVIQISDYNLPDDPYAFKDTVVSVFYNWETEQMQCNKTPKGEYAIGFKADQLWFYMKLEDLLPYLPKEVLPSLELLKKE